MRLFEAREDAEESVDDLGRFRCAAEYMAASQIQKRWNAERVLRELVLRVGELSTGRRRNELLRRVTRVTAAVQDIVAEFVLSKGRTWR